MWHLLLISLSLFVACAQIESESAEYKEVFVPAHKERWRFCDAKYDGEKLHRKGMCRQGKECKNRFLKSDLCRPKPYFCAWGDLACMDKYNLWPREIILKAR